MIEYVERIILIRDVRNSFYVTGISERYNSLDSVLEKEMCNSACNKWFDLRAQLQDNDVPIFYFYSALNESDINQVKCTADIKNIYPIAIRSSVHAQSVSTEPYIRLLCAAKEDIFKIYNANKESMVDLDILENQINTLVVLPNGVRLSWATTNEKKQKAYMDLLYEWVKLKQNICTEMKCCDRTAVAVWGKGKYCKLLLNELEKQNIEVKCIIETQPLDDEFEGIPIINISNLYKDIDTIVVVPYYDIKSIKERIYEYYRDIKVIGIDEYIKWMYSNER